MILRPEFSFPLSYYLIPFTGVVGMIILVMCVVLVSGDINQVHLHASKKFKVPHKFSYIQYMSKCM